MTLQRRDQLCNDLWSDEDGLYDTPARKRARFNINTNIRSTYLDYCGSGYITVLLSRANPIGRLNAPSVLVTYIGTFLWCEDDPETARQLWTQQLIEDSIKLTNALQRMRYSIRSTMLDTDAEAENRHMTNIKMLTELVYKS